MHDLTMTFCDLAKMYFKQSTNLLLYLISYENTVLQIFAGILSFARATLIFQTMTFDQKYQHYILAYKIFQRCWSSSAQLRL